jgi:cbb3-type cytochrome oxidase maturation protein
MNILFLMILASVSLGVVFLILFLICAKNDQFEEGESPALRILKEENLIKEKK